MAELRAVYLIHGDDHGALSERRAGLRALAERGPGAGAVEQLEGERATPAAVAAALATMTLCAATPEPGALERVILVEGVERWKGADVENELAPELSAIAPGTVLALVAREDARAKAPTALHEAVKRAGGQVVARMTPKPWELPKWVGQQAMRMGLSLDSAAAKALVDQVGERPQRLLRELEKLALETLAAPAPTPTPTPPAAPAPTPAGEPTQMRTVSAEDVELRAAYSAEWKAYSLADALVGGDEREAVRCYVCLREQGERASGLIYIMAGRLREALAIAVRLAAGEPAAAIKRGLRMPPRAAERLIADVARSDPERLRGALQVLAALELDSRGGPPLTASRSALYTLSEDTLALRAIAAAAA